MKTSETKTSANTVTHAKNTVSPFFSKEGQGGTSFFGGETMAAESFFSPRTIQPKLTIGTPNDVYEQQADSVADQVVAKLNAPQTPSVPPTLKGSPTIQPKCAACEKEEKLQKKEEDLVSVGEQVQMKPIFESAAEPSPDDTVQRKCAECEKEEAVQRKTDGNTEGAASPDLLSRLNASKGGGQPLPADTRTSMESAMGADFSNVRVHTGSEAVQMSQGINAQAFTHGSDVYFNSGKYNPSDTEGTRLLAHELTHTVQQRGVNSLQKASISNEIIQRKGFESTINICHRVLKTRTFNISNGGVRVALQIYSPNTEIVDCQNHDFYLSLTRPTSWWRSDQTISTCKVSTGKDSTIQIGGLPSGDYYFTIWRTFDHPYCCVDGNIQVYDEAISASDSTCTKIKELTTMDIVHGALDIAGFIPVLGAVPDGINAIIYVTEGDWVNAGISAVAMIPALGDGAKAVTMGGKAAIKVSERTALKLGEEGMAKALKEAKAVHAAEEAVKVASQAEKTAAKTGSALIEISKEMKTVKIGAKGWRQALKFTSKQEGIVYILKTEAGEILKIGKSKVESVGGRFAPYLACANKLGIILVVDVFTIEKNSSRTIESIESEIRNAFGAGKSLPWDNTGGRLGRKGSGLPPQCH